MSPYRPLTAIVLAAGEGIRMRSDTPKVLHELCGRPMLAHVIDALSALALERIVVVVGHGADRVTKTLQEQLGTDVPVEFVEQRVQRGTGDATSVGLTAFDSDGEGDVIVMPGDAPLVRPEVLARLATEHRRTDAAATALTAALGVHTQDFGRIVCDEEGRLERIVERVDASPEELGITEVNTSIYCFRLGLLTPALRRLSPENARGEYYLTDTIAVLRDAGHVVVAVAADDSTAAMHVNDRAQLAIAEAELRRRINHEWMDRGVGMTDPDRTYVDAAVKLEPDVHLMPGTILQGSTVVGAGSVIGPDTRLVDTVVGERSVLAQVVARESHIGDDVTVGPFAHLRPGTRLADGVHVGGFVEMKNSEIAEGAKVPHLAYVGDAEIGPRANLGAGTVTANYDGKRKHRTIVGADAQISSNTVLVAPVEVGEGAYTAAGAVVNRDVPAGAMAKGVPARIEEGWVDAREDEPDES